LHLAGHKTGYSCLVPSGMMVPFSELACASSS
jgi:hypothetical protein